MDELTGSQHLLYERRRIDEMRDDQIRTLRDDMRTVKEDMKELDRKVDLLSLRLALLAGGLAIVTFVANIIGPVIASKIFGVV